MKKNLLPIIALFLAAITFQSCYKSKQIYKTVNIQGLFSLTGNWSSLGLTSKAAMELAKDDINTYLLTKNANFNINVAVSDTKLDVENAKTQFNRANADGIKFIIGPQSSAELAGIKPLVDAANILVVSQSSTAGSLAIADDAIFRFCPSDKIEGAASGATIYKQGIRGLITVARDDAGNKGLQTSTGAAFLAKGGSVSAIAAYSTTTTNYAPVIASIKTEVTRLSGIHGAANVGVYLASFDEATELFKLASSEPTLNSIKWYGGDGVVLSTALLADAVVAEFAIKTGFSAPSFGLPAALQSQWQPVANRIKAKTGIEPDAYALAVYDAMWTIVKTIEANNGDTSNFAKTKSMFVAEANRDTGITGADALDAAGDRASGTFDYFGIVKNGTTYKWTFVGKSDN